MKTKHRNLLMLQDPRTHEILDCSDSLKSRYLDQSKLCKPAFLLSALSIINKADLELPAANNKRLHTEVALSKICFINRVVNVSSTLTAPSLEKKNLVMN